MGLILCVKIGKPFFVDSCAVFIREIISPTHFTVSVNKKVFDITAEEFVEILPNVQASCGGSCPEDFVKVVLVAPPKVIITRECIYRERKKAAKVAITNQALHGSHLIQK